MLLNAMLLLEYILMHARPGDIVRLLKSHVAESNEQYVGYAAEVVCYQGGGWYIVEVPSVENGLIEIEIPWRGTRMVRID